MSSNINRSIQKKHNQLKCKSNNKNSLHQNHRRKRHFMKHNNISHVLNPMCKSQQFFSTNMNYPPLLRKRLFSALPAPSFVLPSPLHHPLPLLLLCIGACSSSCNLSHSNQNKHKVTPRLKYNYKKCFSKNSRRKKNLGNQVMRHINSNS